MYIEKYFEGMTLEETINWYNKNIASFEFRQFSEIMPNTEENRKKILDYLGEDNQSLACKWLDDLKDKPFIWFDVDSLNVGGHSTKEEFLETAHDMIEEYICDRGLDELLDEPDRFIVIETECGFKAVPALKYSLNKTDEGYCFKDRRAFESGEGVCYISEAEYVDYQEDIKDALFILDPEVKCRILDEINNNVGYTRQNILDEAFGNEKIARYLFDVVEWECISTCMNDFVENLPEDDFETFGITDSQAEEMGLI